MTSVSRITRSMLRRSHELQFGGMDYQAAGWEIYQDAKHINGPLTDDELNELHSSPDPGCECGFCANADWQ